MVPNLTFFIMNLLISGVLKAPKLLEASHYVKISALILKKVSRLHGFREKLESVMPMEFRLRNQKVNKRNPNNMIFF